MQKHRNLFAALAIVVGHTIPLGALAQGSPMGYPSRPITLVVPYAAGGLADLIARVTAVHLEGNLHQPVVVTNRSGASGAIGTAFVAKTPADGYTLLLTLTSHVVIPETDRLQGRVPAYELAQFRPVARISFEPVVLVGQSASPHDTVQKVVDAARANPGTLNYSSTGYYANGHISMETFAQAAGLKMLHVPYQGGSQALLALAGGHVNLATAAPATASSFAKSGKLRPLAVLGTKRLSGMPEVPTLTELGYSGTYYVWSGLFAPASTPAAVLDTLRSAMRAVAADPNFIAAMEKTETQIGYQDAPEFESFLEPESRRLIEVTKRIGRVGKGE